MPVKVGLCPDCIFCEPKGTFVAQCTKLNKPVVGWRKDTCEFFKPKVRG